MLPLFDMLSKADNGKALDLLARQYGLTQQQVELATEALLPAFSQGLKRNAADPYGISNFLQAMASGNHAQYFDQPDKAVGPQGEAEGNAILGHLFGSKELSRAVAAHAAQSTGIAQSILQKMLPALAAMIMGGLFKQSTGQVSGQQGGGNILGSIIEQMMRGGLGGASPTPQTQQASPLDNPFGKILQDMLGGATAGGATTPKSGGSSNPLGDTPWGKMFEDILGGSAGTQKAQPAPEPAAAPSPEGAARNPYDDLFGNMFETGRKTRDDYQKGTEAIFDQFIKGMDKHR